jgi:hypothetical protein
MWDGRHHWRQGRILVGHLTAWQSRSSCGGPPRGGVVDVVVNGLFKAWTPCRLFVVSTMLLRLATTLMVTHMIGA